MYVLRLKIRALVPMVLKQQALLVLRMVPTFVRRVPVDSTKLVPLALGVNPVVLAPEKQQLVLLQLIEYVHKTSPYV